MPTRDEEGTRRACAVAMAAGHDLNDELTILANCLIQAVEQTPAEDPRRFLLVEARRSVQRCIWKTSGLINYGARHNARPTKFSMERLILDQSDPLAKALRREY